MIEEKLSYAKTKRRFDIAGEDRIRSWERIYLTEGPEGFTIERRGRGNTDRPKKLSKAVEEDLLTEVQRLRAEDDYLRQDGRLQIKIKDLRRKHYERIETENP